MAKTKIFVRNVVNTNREFDVVFAEIKNGDNIREVQICMPKYCNMMSLIGKEAYYETKNGSVQVTPVKQKKKKSKEDKNVVSMVEV